MGHFIKVFCAVCFFVSPNSGYATSPIYCENTIQDGMISGVVTKIEDRSHLAESTYLAFYLDDACRHQRFAVKRSNFSELNLKEIKKSILISYSVKRKLKISVPQGNDFPAEVEVNLNQPIGLE